MREFKKLILIALDMLRADHVGCYGYPRETSPNIDALAAKGTRFADCTSAFCCTVPSFTSMLTGKLPLNHGVVINPWSAANCHSIFLDDECPTIAERLWSEDFLTAAVDNLINFASHPNWFARGYQHLMNATGTAASSAHLTRGAAINAELLPWLRANHQRDFFVFVHYWDPHGPFTQPEEYNEPFRQLPLPTVQAASGEEYVRGAGLASAVAEQGRELVDEYDGATRFVDERVGEVLGLLDDLDIAQDTAVIVTSDHGRTDFGRPDPWRARGVYQGTMHVPLIVCAPGVEAHQVVEHPVHGTDLAPTIMQLLGRQVPGEMDGTSLLAAMAGGPAPHELIGACGAYRGAPQRLLRKGSLKLVRTYADAIADLAPLYEEEGNTAWTDAPQVQVYDLAADGFESVDLAAQDPDLAAELCADLDEWKAANADDPKRPDPLIENSRWGIKRDSTLVN